MVLELKVQVVKKPMNDGVLQGSTNCECILGAEGFVCSCGLCDG